MKKSPGFLQLRSRTPEGFRGHLAGLANGVCVSQLEARDFRAEALLGGLPRARMFQVSMKNGAVILPENTDFVSVEWPIVGGLRTIDEGREVLLRGDRVHYCRRGAGFHFEFPETRVQVLQFMQPICEEVCALDDAWETSMLESHRPHMKTADEKVRRLQDYARVMWDGMAGGSAMLSNELTAKPFEDALAIALVDALHDSREAGEKAFHKENEMLRRAEDYMRANLTKPISVLDVARELGVSVRTLQRQFEASFHEGPAGLLRRWRFEAFHQALAESNAGESTVTDIAAAYGFSYSGRLAGAYRRQFGESPSDTLSG